MKKLIITLSLVMISASSFGQKTTGYQHMNPGLWKEDLEYLQKKINKEFNSFNPGVKTRFSEELISLIPKLNSLENYQVPGEIQRLLSLLKDGHTELNIGHRTVKFHRVPLSLYWFEGDFYVLAAHKPYRDLVGGKVKRIGSMPIDQAFEKLKANMSRDNEMEYIYAGPGYIKLTELLAYLGISDDPYKVSFSIEKADGETVSQSFEGLTAEKYSAGPWAQLPELEKAETPLSRSQPNLAYWYKYLPEQKALYFYFGRTNNQKGMPSIRSFSKKMWAEIDELKPEKFIIDLRTNNGGNYHLTKPIWQGIKERAWLDQPGKVWAVTSRRTFSASATFCIFLKQHTQTQLIGEVSRTHPNASDNNEYMTLPNSGFLIEYTTRIKVHWPERPGADRIPVDVTITPTFEAYKAGRDLVLEYLLKGK